MNETLIEEELLKEYYSQKRELYEVKQLLEKAIVETRKMQECFTFDEKERRMLLGIEQKLSAVLLSD